MVRSRSAPNLEKETTLKRMDSFFCVIPSTPRVEEADATTPTPTPTPTPTDNNEDENQVDDAEDIPE
ncbi:hypothetical protein Hdeb2414_s0530g00911891 [Helianthus debilis subsp. tardiflorus]